MTILAIVYSRDEVETVGLSSWRSMQYCYGYRTVMETTLVAPAVSTWSKDGGWFD